MKKVENEGLGLGFLDFLDDIEVKAKKDKSEYRKPQQDYKFNMDEFEVALGESDLNNGADGSQDDVEDYDDEEGEVESNEDQAGLSDESYYQDQDDVESVEAIIPSKMKVEGGDDDDKQSLSESDIEDDLNPG